MIGACQKYNLDPLAGGVILSHAEGAKRGIAANHFDPEHLWRQLSLHYSMDTFRAAVKEQMTGSAAAMPAAPVVTGKDIGNVGFHAFCRIYHNETWFYVDARGITSNFDEFLDGISIIIAGDYIIRPVESGDILEWESDCSYNTEGYAFSESIINKYRECYTLGESS